MHFRAVLLALVCACLAQPAVRHFAEKKLWVLDTNRTTYAVGVAQDGTVQNVYWGASVRAEDLPAAQRSRGISSFDSPETMRPEEFPAWGGLRFYEPALKVTFDDGNRDVVLHYVSHTLDSETLTIRTKDIKYDLFVDLVYRVFPREDMVRRSVRIENRTPKPLTLESAQSAVWNLPRGEGYRLTHLVGRWAAETQLTREPLEAGKKVLESRKGHTSHNTNPWFALDRNAGEEHGDVFFGALGWSGNWKIVAEQTPYWQTRVTGGMNDFDFSWPLKSGESLDTPPFYAGFTNQGFGEASRLMHRLIRREILPDRASPKVRPVLYNSWEATTFNVNEAGQKALAEQASKLGVELFTVDDGWFGARNHDRAGLGDWIVSKQKFPQGMKPLIAAVNQLGMKFGLWFEPEMINPDSDLYRAHPDWVLHFPGRPRSEARNQLVLNMARDDVKEHIFNAIDKVLAENNIEFIKWDMNRPFGEPGWASMPLSEQKEVWVKYVRNVYEIFDRLRAKYPKLELESCSGGGGRIDLGILQRVDQVWTSDNTEAFDRLRIQEGFTYAYAPKIMMAWVTDVPNMNGRSTSLKYRFLVAMAGSLGIGANLAHFKPEDTKLATEMIALYKDIRQTVQTGDLYRLLSPSTENLSAVQYVSENGKQAVLFAYLHSQQYNRPMPAIQMRGLDPKALYKIRAVDDRLGDRLGVVSGAYLMNRGVNFRLRGDYDASAIILDRQ